MFPGRLLRIIAKGDTNQDFIPGTKNVGNKGRPSIDTGEWHLYNLLVFQQLDFRLFSIFFNVSIILLQGAKPRSPLWTSTCPDFWAAGEPNDVDGPPAKFIPRDRIPED